MSRSVLRPASVALLCVASFACGQQGGGEGSGSGGSGTDGSTSASSTDAVDESGDGEVPLTCGNGMLDDGEDCDGADFGGLTCADFGGAGALVCDQCRIDDSGCALEPSTRFGDPIAWDLPEGGDMDGFWGLGDANWDPGEQSWATIDMTGDAMPDLVVFNNGGMPYLDGSTQVWFVHPNNGSGFGAPTTWTLPEGGDADLFWGLADSNWDPGEQSWATLDMTADGLPDLVVFNEGGSPYLDGETQVWFVYPGTGSGFGAGTTWTLPEGGDADRFWGLADSNWDPGEQSWATLDMTGDGIPDLVVFNDGGTPYVDGDTQIWIVYPGTGSGFGASMAWELPDGGDADRFWGLADANWDPGEQSWATTDLTGDGRPDLVVFNNGGTPFLDGDTQSWIVYPNTGAGFGSSIAWELPDGGDADRFWGLADANWDPGEQSWATTDLTGDGLVDLVVLNVGGTPFLDGDAQIWAVHPNTGAGFGPSFAWPLPDGGDADRFWSLADTNWDPGEQSWATLDMTGDARVDLVILNVAGQTFEGPSWLVYPGAP